MDYNKYDIDFENRGKMFIEISLRNLDPLHIGGTASGTQVSEMDLLCVKHNDGTPFIPGSSFRGFFRSLGERFSHLFKNNSIEGLDMDIHHKFPPDKKNQDVCDLEEVLNEITSKPEDEVEDYLISNKKICDLCLLFGANHYGSPLRVSDFNPLEKPTFEHRTHIKIDRESDTAKGGALFYVEAIEPGTIFIGKLILEKRGHKHQRRIISYLILLLEYLSNNEIYLGGLKSRGYGRMECDEIRIKDYSLKDEILGKEKEFQEITMSGGKE